jgi:hypothetical protein
MRIIDAMASESFDISRSEKYWERILIIDDVRYQNEIDMILRQGGQLMHVYAGERLPYPRARWRAHESEKLAKNLDKTQGVQHRIERFFNVKMPWDGPVEHDMYWLNNETTVEDLNKMIKLVAPFVLGIKVISAADKEEVYLNDLSDEEREELFREIAEALRDLFDKAAEDYMDETGIDDPEDPE